MNAKKCDQVESNEQEERCQESEDVLSFKLETRRDQRVLAFNIIYAMDRSDYSMDLDTIVASFTSEFDLVISEDSFILTLIQGVIDQRDELDVQIKPYLKNWKLERLGCCTRLILRMSLWELQNTDTAMSIVINEAVELAKKFAEKDAYKFINGILDEMCKNGLGQETEEKTSEE